MTPKNALHANEMANFVTKCLCVGLVLFSLYTALFGVLPDIIQRGVHLSTVLLLYKESNLQDILLYSLFQAHIEFD